MDILISQLDKKHAEFMTKIGSRSSSDFFSLVYEYLAIVETQPELKEIVENDKLNVSSENQKFSLYFCYGELHRDIYTPMAKYRRTPNLTQQEIIGTTKISNRLMTRIALKIAKLIARVLPLTKGKDDKMEAYFAIQKLIDNAGQTKYWAYFDRLHHGLIPQLLKLNSKKKTDLPDTKDNRIKIILDHQKGLYRADNEKLLYPIKRRTKRFKLIKYLSAKDDCGLNELAKETNQDNEVVIKEVRKINHLFRRCLDVADDLIVHHQTGGYSLNKKSFLIKVNS